MHMSDNVLRNSSRYTHLDVHFAVEVAVAGGDGQHVVRFVVHLGVVQVIIEEELVGDAVGLEDDVDEEGVVVEELAVGELVEGGVRGHEEGVGSEGVEGVADALVAALERLVGSVDPEVDVGGEAGH